ncbi:hypothetical protein WDM22_02070 [Bradyrhizobium septentrionale]|uniref:hypothetical protein n=1 Tax=Bradyrhizobium septentrionale TaxID=1404411 RepID=UPI0030CD6288
MAHGPDEGWRRHVLEHMLPRMEATSSAATGLTPAPIAESIAPTSFSLPSGPPNVDVVERLPPAAAERLRLQRDRRSEKRDAMIPHSALQEAIAERTHAEQHHCRLQAHPQDSGQNLPPSHPSVVAAEREVARTRDNARRLQERSEKLAAAWRAASLPLAACEDYLRHGVPSGVQLLDYDGPEPVLLKGEKGSVDAIENRGRRVRELKADLHRIQSAPFPSSYAKQRMREMVEQLAARGTPDVTNLIEHDRNIIWPTLRVQSEVHGAQRSLAFHEATDVVGLFAAILKPAMISFLDTLVDAEKDDAAALSHEARQQAEAEVMADLLAVERDECALIWAAQAQGLPVEFRADISPIAMLGLRLVTTPRADPPDSSEGHAGFDLIGGRR